MTVLFADVAGSVGLAESLDAEDLRALLGRYYAIAKEAVASHGGTVEKFIGDAVVAAFGVPIAHGDDAARALLASLALRDRIREDASLAERVRVRCGVATGEVIAARDTAPGDFLVAGDAVNVAARLQQHAAPWEILVTDRTAHAAGPTFAFGPFGQVTLKGRQATVRSARLLGRSSWSRRRTPFFGRDAELARLGEVAERTFRDRRPASVTLVAPAGTGKTRLLEEFLSQTTATTPDVRVLTAQCLPYGQRLTYWPLRGLLLRLLELADDADADAVTAAAARWLGDAGADHAERVAGLLATTIGLGAADVSDAADLRSAWRTLVEAQARRGPLVVVLEDLHWASASLLDLLDAAIEPHGPAPLLTIALARPELQDRARGWLTAGRDHLSLWLEPLDTASVGELVRHLLGSADDRLLAGVVARSEGNPFFAVELTRSILDRHRSARDVPSEDAGALMLPDTVQATVLARIDMLPGAAARALRVAAVFGRTFTPEAAMAVAQTDRESIDVALELLVARDLLRWSDAGELAFRHMLIREVAYGTLTRAERAALHAAAGAWVEERSAPSDSFAEIIAYHYREAASLAASAPSLDAVAVRRKAVEWSRRAAERAFAAAAHVEAVTHLRSAIALAEGDVLADLYERLGDAFTSTEAADAYRKALELRRAAHRPADEQLRAVAGVLHVHFRSGGMGVPRGTYDVILGLRDEGRALLDHATGERAIARFLAADAFYPFWRRRTAGVVPPPEEVDHAEAEARRALEIAERYGDLDLVSMALDGVGTALMLRGRFREARDLALRRLAMGEKISVIERLDAYGLAVWLSYWMGDLAEADRVSAEGLPLASAERAPAWGLNLISWRALALMRRGRWDEVLALGDRSCDLWQGAGRPAHTYALTGMIAALAVARARNDVTRASRYRDMIDDIAARIGDHSPHALPGPEGDELDRYVQQLDRRAPESVELALAFASDGGHPAAARFTDRLAAAEEYRAFPLLQGEIHRALGLARSDGSELARAVAIFEEHGALPAAARARCEHAALIGSREELAVGVAALEELGDLAGLERFAGRRLAR